MTAPTVSVQYEDLKAIASHFDHHAQEIIKVYRFISNQVHELRTEYWVGDNADIFYTSMDSDILPALSRLQQALAEGGDTTRDIIAIFQQAEEDGAAAFNGDDRVVSDDNRTRPVSRRLRQGVRQQASSDDMVGNNLEEDNRPPLCLDEPYGDCTNDITEANFQSVVNYLLSLMSMPNSIFTSDHVSDVDFDAQEIVARGLAQAIQNGDLDWPSVLQLLLQAQNETDWSFSPSATILYALAMADKQGENWQAWEDENFLPVIYFGGSNGVFKDYGNVLGGGNCAMFLSMAYLAGRTNQSDIWGLGDFDIRHSAYRGISDGTEFYAGVTTSEGDRAFTGARSFANQLGQGNISSDIRVTPYINFNNIMTRSQADRDVIFEGILPGDLIFSMDNDGTALDHVAIVVGWGNSIAGEPGLPFYPTKEAAIEAGVTDPVPYAVDHGGLAPQSYPRPWTETVTTTQIVPQEEPDVSIYIYYIRPSSQGEE